MEHRRLSYRSIVGANRHRQQVVEARLIGTNTIVLPSARALFSARGPAFFFPTLDGRFFVPLLVGQTLGLLQRESPSLASKRLTCAGWYLSPNSRRITSATLSHVHTPLLENRTTVLLRPIDWATCSGAFSLTQAGRCPTSNPALQAFDSSFASPLHPLVHRSLLAHAQGVGLSGSGWVQPSCLSSQALNRLPSRQSAASFESELSMSRSYHSV